LYIYLFLGYLTMLYQLQGNLVLNCIHKFSW
jgi:hypothetical protein